MGVDASRSGLPCGHLQGHGDLLRNLAVLPKTATLLISKILIHTLWLTNLLQTLLFSAPCNMFCNLVLCGLLILTQLDEISAAMAQVLLPSKYLPGPKETKPSLPYSKVGVRLTHGCPLILFCCYGLLPPFKIS